MKTCRKCKAEKALTEFHPNPECRQGVVGTCKECRKTTKAAYQKREPEKHKTWRKKAERTWRTKNRDKLSEQHRANKLRRKYGITLAEYDQLLASQQGRCAICRTDMPGGWGNRLHVDHDHATGKVRGLLCTNCNRAIGHMKDDTFNLMNAIAYLGRLR